MHIIGSLHKHHKAVGSIIGAIFFLLIMIMGYTLFTIGNQAVKVQEQNIYDMRVFDLERGQEALFKNGDPVLVGQDLSINLQNVSPRQTIVKNVGVWDTHSWVYNRMELTLNSGEIGQLVINIPGIQSITPPNTVMIQIITERGVIFSVPYKIE